MSMQYKGCLGLAKVLSNENIHVGLYDTVHELAPTQVLVHDFFFSFPDQVSALWYGE